MTGVNGLDMHVLEAGDASRPALLLLHGFPELAWSWRKLMPALAQAGYHVIAPDQRGYGRTTGWDGNYDGDLASYRLTNLVRDQLQLLEKLQVKTVAAVIGHDFGSPVAAWCALLHPQIFRSLVLMSAPFGGPPATPVPPPDPVHDALAALPRPRKHYQWYYSTREAAADMAHCPQGLHAFLRAYYHMKSADWKGNRPPFHPRELESWSAVELAKMPTYYIMDLGENMAQTVAPQLPASACEWLTDDELRVYSAEFARTGFQAALQWYRCRTTGRFNDDLCTHHGKRITVPACFISGASDWGPYQRPGEITRMRTQAFADDRGCHFVAGAGHWVQQEQPAEVTRLILDFLKNLHGRG